MRPSWSTVALSATLLATAAAVATRGTAVFSPGPLHAIAGEPLGGVRAHAELGDACGACHGASMDERCLACHEAVGRERADTTSLHGSVGAAACRACHTEHRGATASLSGLGAGALRGWDHANTAFPLTGAHAGASCRACHESSAGRLRFAGTTGECVACHEAEDEHRGELGRDCGACHGTGTWAGARFEHSFPLRHGRRAASACSVCHQDAPGSFATYTCYGCHEHTPANIRSEHLDEGIRDYRDCMHCHPTGRED